MLGAHGQKLCRNLDVHWVTQTCGPRNETGTTYDIVFCWHCIYSVILVAVIISAIDTGIYLL